MVLGFPALKRGGQHTARVSLRAVLPVEVEAAGISVGDYDNPTWKAACPPVRLRVLPSPIASAPRQEEVEVRALPYEPLPVIDPPRARGWTSTLDAR
jgi:hypothetical protein